jgi:hypothetical protein
MTSVYVAAYDSTLHTHPKDFQIYYYECDIFSFEYVGKEWTSLWLPWN